MRITNVTTHLMGIPGPGGHAPSRNSIFVRVETDAGITGVGEATTEYHEQAVAAMVEQHFAPLLIGADSDARQPCLGTNATLVLVAERRGGGERRKWN